jgi:hypothetical protein
VDKDLLEAVIVDLQLICIVQRWLENNVSEEFAG